MDLFEYQTLAGRTAVYPGQGEFNGLAYAALGLNGEAGEVAEKVKKLWRDNGVLNHETVTAIVKELGDVLWYCAAVADEIGVSLNEAAVLNIEKLQSRQARNALSGSGDDR